MAQAHTQARDERPALVKARLVRARQGARELLDAGASGLKIAHVLSDAFDASVRELLGATSGPGSVALLATGGWGRRDVAPYSDMDLLFLCDRPDCSSVAALADELLYPLWDAGVAVGHAVRDITDTVELAHEDLPTATALLDARLVAGNAELAARLVAELHGRLSRTDGNAFVQALLEEKRRRHEKFGESVYLLEPNLKHGEGALRDLATGGWAARFRWQVSDFEALVPLGQATARQVNALGDAHDFLLRLRAALQLEAGRRTDQLTFELQEAIAPRFFPDVTVDEGDIRPAVAPAVEALMRQYYLHAKAVVRETDRLCDRALRPPRRAPTVHNLDSTFAVWNRMICTRDPARLRERPGDVMRLFAVSLTTGLPIYGHTQELVAELMDDPAERAAVMESPDAKRLFLQLLADPRDAGKPSVLEKMHELGVLAAMIPEFAPCTGRVQHDLYHVYTVDRHQLYTVALLKQIMRGETPDAPGPTRAAHELTRPVPLVLATLLHDVGKPLGKGHSDKGARIALQVGRRLGLSEEDAAQAAFLVKQHLLMSHISQRRDLSDRALIAQFAGRMKDAESLRQLYLLTYADTSMTAPGNMTDWKATLLAELYDAALRHFREGPAGMDELDVVADGLKARVAELLGETLEGQGRPEGATPLDEWFAGLPARYFFQNEAQVVLRHVMQSRARGEKKFAMHVQALPREGCVELTLCTDDEPGLLGRVAGVMYASGLDVMSARIAGRVAVGDPAAAEALDVFYLRRRSEDVPDVEDPVWQRVRRDLERVLAGGDVRQLVERRRGASRLPSRHTPEVPTEVFVHDDASAVFTVIDVFIQDEPGILYEICRVLDTCGLDIALSKLGVEGERVTDVFYVLDRQTRRKIPMDRLAPLQADIVARLGNRAT